jgi:hypothetical protein
VPRPAFSGGRGTGAAELLSPALGKSQSGNRLSLSISMFMRGVKSSAPAAKSGPGHGAPTKKPGLKAKPGFESSTDIIGEKQRYSTHPER